jgi:hypothetical protein
VKLSLKNSGQDSILTSFCLSILFLISVNFSWSQVISIGTPQDGTEGGANSSFTVFIEGGGVNTTGNAITGLISYSGTSDFTNDFTGAVSFSIPTGVNSVQIPLIVIDDEFIELNETIIATISNLSNGTIGVATASAAIVDNDLMQLQVSIGEPENRIEGTGSMSFKVFFEGGLKNFTGTYITGDLTYTGTATNGVDFTAIGTFSMGGGMSSTTINISVFDDVISESPETIVATISNLSVGSVLTPSSTATLFDDDSNATLVSIGFATSGVEGSTDVSFWAFLADGSSNTTGAPITGTVSYAGTAINGVDYTAPVSFSIPAGASADTIDVVLLDDALPEPIETITATISNLNTGFIVNSSRETLITDDDAQALVVSIGMPVIATEGTSDVSFDVFLVGGAINNSGMPIVGSLSYFGSTALYGADFVPVDEFVIPAGASSTTVVLSVLDDPILEPVETVEVILSSLNLGVLGNIYSSSEIFDDDSGQYSVSATLTDGEEGGADISLTIALDNGVVNTSGVPISGTINYAGTANSFLDIVNTPVSFSIANGANSVQLTLPVVDDQLIECDESIIVNIDNINAGSIGSAADTALIIDNECGVAEISIQATADGGELQSDVEFVISFNNGILNGTGAVITGTLDLSGGTATPDLDFIDQQDFQIGIGVNATNLSVEVIDEFDIEGTETIVATISNLSFGTIGVSTDTAFIFDNETSSLGVLQLDEFQLFPNPVDDELTIAADRIIKSYSLMDVQGREISRGNVGEKMFQLYMDTLPPATYLIEIVLENDQHLRKKVIKE